MTEDDPAFRLEDRRDVPPGTEGFPRFDARRAGAAAPAIDPRAYGGLRRAFYLLGAAAVAVVIFGSFNPVAGFTATAWPWDVLLRSEGAWASRGWDEPRGQLTVLVVMFLTTLVAAALPSGRARGVAVLLAGSLAVVAFYIRMEQAVEDYAATVLAAGVVAAGAVAAATPGARFAGRALLFAGLLGVASQVLVPYPLRGEIDVSGETAQEQSALEGVVQDVGHPENLGENRKLWDSDSVAYSALLDPPLLYMLLLFALTAVGVLALVGLGGRWAASAAAVLLLLLVFAPPAVLYHHYFFPHPSAEAQVHREVKTVEMGLSHATGFLRPRLTAFLLPLVAATLDLVLGRFRTRPT